MAERLHLIPASQWGLFPLSRPMVIAGPCAAESEEQLRKTAEGIVAAGICVFRAGIWKPRTHPGGFEGVGTPGLRWLQKIRREYGLKVCTEVACARHVDECTAHGLDMVWIGARTTANPFLVQEIADALRGADIPVLVKNPVSPDLDLWIGALERLNQAGVWKLGAVHRGFSSWQRLPYRNQPGWRIAIEMKTLYPELPFFADPSHMAGERKYLRELSQRAMDLGLEGLMIESHCNPDQALSDAGQQLTPEALRTMLTEQIVVREPDSQEPDYQDNIKQLRARIDAIDESLIALIRSRMTLSEKIGHYKKDHNIAVLQTARWDDLMEQVIWKGNTEGLEPRFLQALFNVIHEESIRIQNDILWSKE